MGAAILDASFSLQEWWAGGDIGLRWGRHCGDIGLRWGQHCGDIGLRWGRHW